MGFLDWVRGVNERLEPEGSTTTPPVPTADDIRDALDRTERLAAQAHLNPVVLARVSRVAGLVRDTLPRLSAVGMGSTDAYAVMATATDYLPEALSSYLRLPRDWADSRPIENGKTSLMLLIDQLDLLGATMDQILDAVARQDANALIAHGRFLQQRFGPPAAGGDLALGTDAAPAVPGPAPASPAPRVDAASPASPRNPLDLA